MHAVQIVDAEVELREVPDPVPGSEELLIKTTSAGLNAADVLQKNGFYPAPPNVPQDIPGLELAGEVVAMGSQTTGFQIGDKVMGIVAGGAQAELCTIHYTTALHVPEGMDLVTAGGFCETYFTAYDALMRQAHLQPGERLLINGAAGGVGLSAISLAVSLSARVTASARNIEHHGFLEGLGAKALAPSDVDGSGPYDVILELVGAINLKSDLAELATEGRLSIIGVGAGAKSEIDLRVVMSKRARIFGSTLRARPHHAKATLVDEFRARILPLHQQQKVPVTIAATFTKDQVKQAYETFTKPGKLGKIILTF